MFGHLLKLWGDKYRVTGEIKGGITPLEHRVLIITSNYTIQELFTGDDALTEALARRFAQFDNISVIGPYLDVNGFLCDSAKKEILDRIAVVKYI